MQGTMLLPTLPDLYINSIKLSIIVDFVHIVTILFQCERDEEDVVHSDAV